MRHKNEQSNGQQASRLENEGTHDGVQLQKIEADVTTTSEFPSTATAPAECRASAITIQRSFRKRQEKREESKQAVRPQLQVLQPSSPVRVCLWTMPSMCLLHAPRSSDHPSPTTRAGAIGNGCHEEYSVQGGEQCDELPIIGQRFY